MKRNVKGFKRTAQRVRSANVPKAVKRGGFHL